MTQNTQPTQAQSQSLAVLERIAKAQEATEQKLDILIELIKHMSDAVNANTAEILFMKRTQGAEAQPQPSRAADVVKQVWGTKENAEQCEQFVATSISYGVMDGKPVYKAKGGKYGKFGVTIWPEVLPTLGIEASQLKFGENPFGKPVMALLKGEKAVKVIGLGQ